MKTEALGNIASIQTGPFGSQLHKKDYADEGTPIVTVEHLGKRRFSVQNLPFVSDEDARRLSRYRMKSGDIIFSRVGSVDRCSYAFPENDGWLFSGRCLCVRCCDSYDSSFLYYWLSSPEVKSYIRSIAVGATMPSINTSLLGEVTVPAVPLESQKRISTLLSNFDSLIESIAKENDYLAA